MNRKHFNSLISILNIFTLILIIVIYIFQNIVSKADSLIVMTVAYDDFIYNLFVNNYYIKLLIAFWLIIAVVNFICAIQNKKDKKLFFWYLIFSIDNFVLVCIAIILDNPDIGDIIGNDYKLFQKIVYVFLPILLAIKDILDNKKNNNLKRINIIFDIVVIIYAILILVFRFPADVWTLLAIVMQFVYIKRQDENFTEKERIIGFICTAFSLIVIIVMSVINIIVIVKSFSYYNENKNYIDNLKKELISLNPKIVNEEYIPVCRDGKWGYLNELGEEVIECKYDDCTSSFYEFYINNKLYQIAIIKNDDNYYLITKDKKEVNLGNKILPYSDQKIYKERLNFSSEIEDAQKSRNEINLDTSYLTFYIMDEKYIENNDEENTNEINFEFDENYNEIYYGDNFRINKILEPDYDGWNEYVDSIGDAWYDERFENYELTEEYVEVVKESGDKTYNFECIDKEFYDDGYIPFFNLFRQIQGYYDQNGDRFEISGKYQILEVRNDNILLKNYETNSEFSKILFIDNSGNIKLEAKEVEILDKGYLIKNENEEIIYLDDNLNQITEPYDCIEQLTYSKELLVCTNINREGKNEVILINKSGTKITNNTYQMIGANVEEKTKKSSLSSYKDFEKDQIYNNCYE